MAEAVRDAAGREDAVVLGNGYGGFLALQMAIRHPDIATRFILADCGAAFSEDGRQAFRNMAAASQAKGLSAIVDVAMRRLFAPQFQAQHPDLMRDRREAFLRTDPQVFRAACDALASLDLRPEVGKVKVPVLVLVGEHDEATPPPMSHELAELLPQAHLEIIPGCAHVPQLQSPQTFLEVIGDFLSAPQMRVTASR
jgi:3-oxoadipate enol-lactonase